MNVNNQLCSPVNTGEPGANNSIVMKITRKDEKYSKIHKPFELCDHVGLF